MAYNSLPGFDAWLTHNPAEEGPEPSIKHLAEAEEQLITESEQPPEEEQIYARAYRLMQEEIEAQQCDEDEHTLDNYLDDREEQVGREP